MAVDKTSANEDVIDPLCELKTTKTEEPREELECRLQLMASPELWHSLAVSGYDRFNLIVCFTSDLVLVNDITGNLKLINTLGHTLCQLDDYYSEFSRPFTVSSESELIYIDKKYNINKLSSDKGTIPTLIEKKDSSWTPLCVYWSPSTGDLLVGMCKMD